MKIDDFFAKPKKVTVLGQELEIMPITTEYLPLINKARNGNTDEKAVAITELSKTVFKQIFPDSSDEDFKKVSLKALDDLMSAFWKVNEEGNNAKEALKNVKRT